MRRLLVLLVCVLAAAGCGGSSNEGAREVLLVVNAPFSRTPYAGTTIARGAALAAANFGVEVKTPDGLRTLKVVRYDNRLSARVAVDNVRRALRNDALAIVDEGTGAEVSWSVAEREHVPICITYQGGGGLIDVERRPNVFRIAPTDRGIAFRLAEYLIPKGLRVALVHDDSGYGNEGAASLDKAFGRNPDAVAARIALPAQALDVAPEVLRARRSGATALLVWAQAPTIAKVVRAARSSGWKVPVYAPPTGGDPLVRQQLAGRPEWVDGLTFASGRMTAEVGTEPFDAFRTLFETTYGPELAGVRTSAGEQVVQPPEYAMYSYDCVRLIAQALAIAGDDRAKLVDALEQVSIRGANGDERSFNERNHEGVVDDDVYFARFTDMTFEPVDDDPLSATLPAVEQLR